jgi:hypothetical protein
MRRVLIVALGLAMVPLANAQRHPARRSGGNTHTMWHGAAAQRIPRSFPTRPRFSSPSVNGNRPFPSFPRSGIFVSGRNHGPIVHNPVRSLRRPYPTPQRPVGMPFPVYGSYGFGFPYSSFGNPYAFNPFYTSPFFGAGYPFGMYSYGSGLSPYALQNYSVMEGLSSEVQQLREQDEALRQQLQQQGIQEQSSSEAPPITVLVFRDGHRLDVRDYAIVGETLWILTDQRATKVPLSELDLEETIQENQERGITFPLPAASSKP